VHVPVWHEATKELWKRGKVQVVGILEEQHPDRARLFMQWKRMDWPLMVDSLNLLEMPAVPVTLCIDEYGIIRLVNPPRQDADKLEQIFLSKTYEKPSGRRAQPPAAPDLSRMKAASGSPTALRAQGDALFLWGGLTRLNEAIEAYQRSLRLESASGATRFHLGVAYRKRYDSEARQTGDFQHAVDEWKAALDIDPNQYGAEFAQPSNDSDVTTVRGEAPDPKGRIVRDPGKLIQIEAAIVPPTKATGSAFRVHVEFRPNARVKAHWNNEAGPLVLWVEPPSGWQANGNSFSVPNPREPVSVEQRRLELELKPPDRAGPGVFSIPAYALYYVCEDVNGVCLYRRQDIRLTVSLGASRNP